MSVTYVDNPDALLALCERLRGRAWIALDTEFMRGATFFAKLCLIQVASEDTIACVDVLRLKDLSPFLDLVYDPNVTKVMHAAGQDLEVLWDIKQALPAPVYDTQIAAAMLGFPLQIGYAGLVQALLGRELDKSQVRTDWERRPLSDEQIRYAADDVRYLRDVYHLVGEKLTEAGRAHWPHDDFRALADPASFAFATTNAWKRLRGLDKLAPKQLQVIRALAAWREERARQSDRPRRWILSDQGLLELAKRLPETMDDLGPVPDIEPNVKKRRGRELLDTIEAALRVPEAEWPVLEPHLRLTRAHDKQVAAMLAEVQTAAKALNVEPAVLATRRDVERFVGGDQNVPFMQGWRREFIGEKLLGMLSA